jgi:hypothetical protein
MEQTKAITRYEINRGDARKSPRTGSVGQLKTVAISPVSFQAPPSNQQERLLIIESETEGLA